MISHVKLRKDKEFRVQNLKCSERTHYITKISKLIQLSL